MVPAVTVRLGEAGSRLLLVAASLLAAFLAGELALRALGYAPERYKSVGRLASRDGRLLVDSYPTNPRDYFDVDLREPEARARYAGLAPHRYDALARRAPWAVESRYNTQGFRDEELGPKRSGVRRVMVLGDSFTEGQGVKEPDTYPRVLERLLDAAEPGRWEVRNCGRRATDFPELLGVFEEVEPHAPDLLIYAMVPNDAQRSADFEARQSYVNDWIINRGAMLIGRPEDSLAPFESRVVALVADRIDVYRIGRETARWYKDMYGVANRAGWQDTQGHIRAMRDRLRAREARFLMLTWPLLVGLEGGYPFEDVSAAVEGFSLTAGILRHDLLPVLRGRDSASLWVHPVDMHPNEVAHRLAAESLAPVVRGLFAGEVP